MMQMARSRRNRADSSDPYWSNVSALLHFDGANFADEISGNVWSSTGNSVAPSSVASKFGGGSLGLSGSAISEALSCPDNERLRLNSSAVTVECWVYPTSLSATWNTIISKDYLANVAYWSYAFAIYNGKLRWTTGNGVSTAPPTTLDGVKTISVNTWSHVAAVQTTSAVRLYINGVLDNTGPAAAIGAGPRPVLVGNIYDTTSAQFAGYIDELRITKGIARYMADFSPPSGPFPNHG